MATGILNWVAIPIIVMVIAPWPSRTSFDDTLPTLLVLLAALFLSSAMILAGLKMKRLEAYGLAVMGSILAIFITPGNIIGLPVGIWSLVTLFRRDVREGFQKTNQPEILPPRPAGTWPQAFWRIVGGFVVLVIVNLALLETIEQLTVHERESTEELWSMALMLASIAGLVWVFWPRYRLKYSWLVLVGGTIVSFLVLLALDNIYAWHLRPNLGLYREPDWVAQHPGFQRQLRQRIENNLWRKPAATPASASESTRAIPATAQTVSFSSVIERVVTNSLSFKTGELGGIPWFDTVKIGAAPSAQILDQKERLLRQQDVDLFIDDGQNLYGIDLKTTPVWDSKIPFEELANRLELADRNTLQALTFGSQMRASDYVFETRKGLRGILQITGFTDNPRGVKLRYKLVQGVSATTNTPTASAETWSPALAPGEKIDSQKILSEAKELLDKGRYEEALQRHLWYHHHALEYDQGQTGVRLSFALSAWVELGRRYPKAKQALIEIRDRDTRALAEGKGYANMFADVRSINRELQDEDATYALFKTIREKDPQLAGQCYFWVESLLVAKGEYQWCYDHMGDPQTRYDWIRQGFDMERDSQQRMTKIRQTTAKQLAEDNRQRGVTNGPAFSPPDTSAMIKKSTEDRFVGRVRQLIEILVATDHADVAGKIRDQAIALLDDGRLKTAVSDAEQKIRSKLVQGAPSLTKPRLDKSSVSIAKPSTLQFRLVANEGETNVPVELLPNPADPGGKDGLSVRPEIILDGAAIAKAGLQTSASGKPEIAFSWTDLGRRRFAELTAANVGCQLAIVYEGKVQSAPRIAGPIDSATGQLTGNWTEAEAERIVRELNQPTATEGEARFSDTYECVLPQQSRAARELVFLALASHRWTTNPVSASQSREFHEWIRKNGADITGGYDERETHEWLRKNNPAEAAAQGEPFPLASCYDAVMVPAATNAWETVTPTAVQYRWQLMTEEAEKKALVFRREGTPNTFYVRTRDGNCGLLQVIGFTDNPRGVRIRYKLVQIQNATAESTTNFYIGPTYFPKADSLEITSVERSQNRMTVKGRYQLVSADHARLALHITTTNGSPAPSDARQRMKIFKGRGDFELIHPHPAPGLPHVSMYPELREPFATLYFGTGAKALEAGQLEGDHFQAARDLVQLTQEAWQLWRSGRPYDAIPKFERAVKLDPNNPEMWNGLAWADFNSGKMAEAEKAFQKVIELEPSHPGALGGLGQIRLSHEKAKADPKATADQVIVEDLALQMLAAIRDKDDATLKSLATDSVQPGWRDALPRFAGEMRERFVQLTDKPFAMYPAESLVEGDRAVVKCTGPKELGGTYLVLFFVKTADGWRNWSLRNSPPGTPLNEYLKQSVW